MHYNLLEVEQNARLACVLDWLSQWGGLGIFAVAVVDFSIIRCRRRTVRISEDSGCGTCSLKERLINFQLQQAGAYLGYGRLPR